MIDGANDWAQESILHKEEVAGHEHVFGIAYDDDVSSLLRVRNELPIEMGLDDSLLFRRGFPYRWVFNGNSILAHRSHQLSVGPRHHTMDVIKFAFRMKRELMRDLHHPVRAALCECSDEYIVFSRNIFAERVGVRLAADSRGGH